MYELKFHPEAKKDLESLDGRRQQLFLKTLKKILKSPQLGEQLGNKANLDLRGFRKIYFDNKKARIVYKVVDDELILFIIAIGKRDDMEVYKKASDRIE